MKTITPNKPAGHSPFFLRKRRRANDNGGRGALQARIATCSFVAAVGFSIAGFCVPPLGDLTDANLYLVAQFLLVTTSIFGVSSIVNKKTENKSNTNETD